MRVLVIGGGIGSLCLAHGLRQAGIEVEVYERTRERADWLQGYRIHLNPDGCRALHACLPPEGWASFLATAGSGAGGFSFRDEQLRPLAILEEKLFAGSQDDPVGQHRSVSRIRLREVLLRGLDDVLREGREFTRYEHTANGRIRAHFADGTSAEGDLLVGADGSNSRVREQYLPSLRRLDTGVLSVAGRYPLDEERLKRAPSELTWGVNSIMSPRSDSMFVAAWRSPGSADERANRSDAQDYLLWAYTAKRAHFPADVEQMDGAALRDVVLERITNWADGLRALVADGDPRSVNSVRLRTMPKLEPWPASTVTLIGDAIHNMTPMGGIGANIALRDAHVLRDELIEVAEGRRELVTAVAEYERQMRRYANRAIALSLRNTRSATSGARLPRLVFTTTLRIAQAVPPLKRAMFAGLGS